MKAVAKGVIHSRPERMIITDEGICTGCGLCELACSLVKEGSCSPLLSRIGVTRYYEQYEFRLAICVQCAIPHCMLACPQDAIAVRDGVRVILGELCTACGLCGEECPFNSDNRVLFAHPSKDIYVKCDLCIERKGGPACVSVCPTGALSLKKSEEVK